MPIFSTFASTHKYQDAKTPLTDHRSSTSKHFLKYVDEQVNCCTDRRTIYGDYKRVGPSSDQYYIFEIAEEHAVSDWASKCDSEEYNIGEWDYPECPHPTSKFKMNNGRRFINTCRINTNFYVVPSVFVKKIFSAIQQKQKSMKILDSIPLTEGI